MAYHMYLDRFLTHDDKERNLLIAETASGDVAISEPMYKLAYGCPQGLKSHTHTCIHAYIPPLVLNNKPTKGIAFHGNTLLPYSSHIIGD